MRREAVPQVGPLEDILFGLRGQLVFDDDRELERAERADHCEYEPAFARLSLTDVADVDAVHDGLQHERRSIEIELACGVRVRVGDGVSLSTLRRVIAALRG